MNGYDFRLIVFGSLSQKQSQFEDTVVISSLRHDNFAIFFTIIGVSGSAAHTFHTESQLRTHENKKIQYEIITPNPLKIVDFDPLGREHNVLDISESAAGTIYNILTTYQNVKPELTFQELYELIAYYAIDILLYYREMSGGVLTRNVVESYTHQLGKALEKVTNNTTSKTELSITIDKFTETYDVIEKMKEFKTKYSLEAAFDS
jgi:hypothetical protein